MLHVVLIATTSRQREGEELTCKSAITSCMGPQRTTTVPMVVARREDEFELKLQLEFVARLGVGDDDDIVAE